MRAWYYCFALISLYIAAWAAALPIVWLRAATLLVLAFAVIELLSQFRQHIASWIRQDPSDLVFWGILFWAFALAGTYTEYPADPLEHVRRLWFWQNLQFVSDHPIWNKYAYFLHWSLVGWLPLSWRQLGVDAIGAFWQLVLAIQIYRLSRTMGHEKWLARMQVIGFVCLFGTNLFGIRYYAVASTALSYCAFLEVLILTLRRTVWWRWGLCSVGLLGVMYFNHHLQEVGFTAIIVSAIVGFRFFARQSKGVRVAFLCFLLVGFLVSIPWGYSVMQAPPTFYIQKGLKHYFSRWGVFLFWNPHLPYLQTLGVHGVIALVSAALYLCLGSTRHGLISFLTLVPFSFICSPFQVYLLSAAIPDPYGTYRILYAFPTSLIFTALLWDATQRITKVAVRAALVLSVLVACGWTWQSPWRGRLRFQFYQPPNAEQISQELDVTTALWVKRDTLLQCRLYGDDPTIHFVASHMGLKYFPDRHRPEKLAAQLGDIHSFHHREDVYGVLLPELSRPARVQSLVGKVSWHWMEEAGSRAWYMDGIETAKAFLIKQGWKLEPVTPAYSILLNPNCRCNRTDWRGP